MTKCSIREEKEMDENTTYVVARPSEIEKNGMLF